MEKKHTVKKIRKYVIATLSSPTLYLYKKPGEYNYSFSRNIETATKTLDCFDAEILLKEYFEATNDRDIEMVVLPLDVTFELIEE